MNRVLVSPGACRGGGVVPLEEAEVHHLRVRRARPGEAVSIHDGAGLIGTGRLVEAGTEWRVEVDAVERRPRPAPLMIAAGAGDRERFGWLVEKAAELGVTEIVPLETAHTSGVATRLRAQHLEKLRRQALEAVKQCGAAWSPTISAPIRLPAFLERGLVGSGWLADAGGEAPPASLGDAPQVLVVGPEGGFSDEERAAVIAAGFRPIALGSHTLRFETAAIAGAAALSAARLRGIHG
ncbi:MAG: RsmE family RNA methyltransferase [Gemmatimonadales bacterium]